MVVIRVEKVKVQSEEEEEPQLVMEPLMEVGVQDQVFIDALKFLKASICT